METQDTETSGANGKTWREGRVARSIEKQTAKLPSDLFLWGALGAMGISLAAQIVGMVRGSGGLIRPNTRPPLSTFVGQWVPTLLLFGVYNKIVKLHGSDRTEESGDEG